MSTLSPSNTWDEGNLWEFGQKVGGFALDFDGDEGMSTPDAMPWTLSFTYEGVAHRFGGFDLDQLFSWAIGFIAGRLDARGMPTTESTE